MVQYNKNIKNKKKGFTLVELMVVLTILGILLAAAVPSLTAYLHLAQFRRNESYAKSIYLSAESTLTYYRGSGQWDSFARQLKAKGVQVGKWDTRLKPELHDRLYAIRLDAEEYGSGESLSDDGALTARLLANDTYDKSTLNGAICLEIDLESGQVYSAFYGAPCDSLRYDGEGGGSDGLLNLSDRAYDSRKAARLGYYSADDVTNVVDLELTKQPDGETDVTDVSYTPYYMLHRDDLTVGQRRHLVNIHTAMAQYEAGTSQLVGPKGYAQLQQALDHCHAILGAEGDKAA